MSIPTVPDLSHLEDPAEREWLTNVAPLAVLRHAHRFYDFLRDEGIPVDSYTRELAFERTAAMLGIDYDVLYNAWVNESPAIVVTVSSAHGGYTGLCGYCSAVVTFEVRVNGTLTGMACRAHVGDMAGNLVKG